MDYSTILSYICPYSFRLIKTHNCEMQRTHGKGLNTGPLPRREMRPVMRSLVRERRCVANSMRTRMPRNRTSSTLTSPAIFSSILINNTYLLEKTKIHTILKRVFLIKCSTLT
jgi:hypothetical protein